MLLQAQQVCEHKRSSLLRMDNSCSTLFMQQDCAIFLHLRQLAKVTPSTQAMCVRERKPLQFYYRSFMQWSGKQVKQSLTLPLFNWLLVSLYMQKSIGQILFISVYKEEETHSRLCTTVIKKKKNDKEGMIAEVEAKYHVITVRVSWFLAAFLNSAIIYSSSHNSKPEWLSFFYGKQKKIFGSICWLCF